MATCHPPLMLESLRKQHPTHSVPSDSSGSVTVDIGNPGRSLSAENHRKPVMVRTLRSKLGVSWRRLATTSRTRWPPVIRLVPHGCYWTPIRGYDGHLSSKYCWRCCGTFILHSVVIPAALEVIRSGTSPADCSSAVKHIPIVLVQEAHEGPNARDLSSVFMSNGRDVTPWHSILESRPNDSQGREVQGTVRRPTACLCHFDYCQHDLGCKSRNFQQRCVAAWLMRSASSISGHSLLLEEEPVTHVSLPNFQEDVSMLSNSLENLGRSRRVIRQRNTCKLCCESPNSQFRFEHLAAETGVMATCHLLDIAEQVAGNPSDTQSAFRQLWKK